jgi:Tfp pilus assembly protein PilV
MKAQIISMDLMIAVLIVMIIIGALGVLLYQYQVYEQQKTESRDLEMKSESAVNNLLMSPGNPSNWNESVV